MHRPFIGVAQVHNLPTPMANHVVIDRVRLLFAAVVLLLQGLVLGTVNGTLGAVYEKFQPRTLFEHSFKTLRVALGQLLLVAQCSVEHMSQTMHPLVGLGLTDAKQKPLHRLSGVLPEVEQDEQEFVCCFNQMRFAASAIATTTGLVDELALDVVIPGILEAGQQGLKLAFAQATQAFEDVGFVLNLGVTQHRLLPVVYPLTLPLFPIKSSDVIVPSAIIYSSIYLSA